MTSARLRPYQERAAGFLAARSRGLVVAPAGAGKTILAAAAAQRVLKPGDSALWVANTREQVEQAIEAIKLFPVPGTEWDVECVAARPDGRRYRLVVMDECHHAGGARTWIEIADAAGSILWGVTATPDHPDEERNKKLREIFGEYFEVSREEVKAGGHLVNGLVRVLHLDRPAEYDGLIRPLVEAEVARRKHRFRFIPESEHRKRVTWQFTSEHLQHNLRRNAAIAATAKTEMWAGEVVIILVGSIAHGGELVEAIPGSALITSKLPAKLRRERIAALRAGELKCAICTSLMDEGADVPVASVLILAAGGRSAAKTVQRTGRVMRPHAGKSCGIVYDFSDRGLVYAHAQYKARLRVYRELGYEIENP